MGEIGRSSSESDPVVRLCFGWWLEGFSSMEKEFNGTELPFKTPLEPELSFPQTQESPMVYSSAACRLGDCREILRDGWCLFRPLFPSTPCVEAI